MRIGVVYFKTICGDKFVAVNRDGHKCEMFLEYSDYGFSKLKTFTIYNFHLEVVYNLYFKMAWTNIKRGTVSLTISLTISVSISG